MKYGLEEDILKKIYSVFLNYPQIEKVVLYGSRAKGNYRNGSDIDLTLFGESLNLEILYKIDNELDDLLLPYSFDLSIYEKLSNKNLLEHIDRAGIVLYNSPPAPLLK